MTLPAIIIGAGGHAKVLADLLMLRNISIHGFVDNDPERRGSSVLGHPVLGDDSALANYPCESVRLVNGVGSAMDNEPRRCAFESHAGNGYSFFTAIHPSAVVADDVNIDAGVQIMAGAIIQSGTRLGKNGIINTGACVDHDCTIGAHVHIAPGAVISGGVKIGDLAHIGCGSTIMQSVEIGPGAVIGAGAVVINDIQPNEVVVGIPARPMPGKKDNK